MFKKLKKTMQDVLPDVVRIGCEVGLVVGIGFAIYACPVLISGVPVLADSMQEIVDELGNIYRNR